MHKYFKDIFPNSVEKDYVPKIGEDFLPWLQYRKRVRRNRILSSILFIMGITVCLMIMGINQAL